MNTVKLERTWATTRHHLERANAHLPKRSPTDRIAQSRARYAAFLEENELELALEQLIAIAEELSDEGRRVLADVWTSLAAAAVGLGLEAIAAYCRQKEPTRPS